MAINQQLESAAGTPTVALAAELLISDDEVVRDLLIGEAAEIFEIAKAEGDIRLATAALATIARLAGFM